MKWSVLKKLANDVSEEDRVYIIYQIDENNNKTIVCKKNNLLHTLWKIYDKKEFINRLDVSLNNKKIIYQFTSIKYEFNKLKSERTSNSLIKNWNNLKPRQKKIYLKLLESQIKND